MKADVKENHTELKKKDFETDQTVRWCPGCGDYMILAMMQKAFSKMGRKKEEFLSVSGIGCSSRITYYLDTYGFPFHSRKSHCRSYRRKTLQSRP